MNTAPDYDTWLLQGSEPNEWIPGFGETKEADICGFEVKVDYHTSKEEGEHVITEIYFTNIPHELLVQIMAHEGGFCDLFLEEAERAYNFGFLA